jgi:hypothetical protein
MGDQPPRGFNPLDAHNALVAAVAMYSGIMQDAQRREAILLAQVAKLQDNLTHTMNTLSKHGIAGLREEPSAVRQQSAATGVSREGSARGDQSLDGGSLGSGVQGQEDSRQAESEKRAGQVGGEA